MYTAFCLHVYLQAEEVPDLITDGWASWELNSGPLEEQSMLLTAKPSISPIPP